MLEEEMSAFWLRESYYAFHGAQFNEIVSTKCWTSSALEKIVKGSLQAFLHRRFSKRCGLGVHFHAVLQFFLRKSEAAANWPNASTLQLSSWF